MENKTAEERFCKVYTEFYGAPIDKAEQIAEHRFNGNELMEFCEFYASQQLAEKDKEIEEIVIKAMHTVFQWVNIDNDNRVLGDVINDYLESLNK